MERVYLFNSLSLRRLCFTSVCHSFCLQARCIPDTLWADTPLGQTPPRQTPIRADTPGETPPWADMTPPRLSTAPLRLSIPKDTVNARVVHILLECKFVLQAMILLFETNIFVFSSRTYYLNSNFFEHDSIGNDYV